MCVSVCVRVRERDRQLRYRDRVKRKRSRTEKRDRDEEAHLPIWWGNTTCISAEGLVACGIFNISEQLLVIASNYFTCALYVYMYILEQSVHLSIRYICTYSTCTCTCTKQKINISL